MLDFHAKSMDFGAPGHCPAPGWRPGLEGGLRGPGGGKAGLVLGPLGSDFGTNGVFGTGEVGLFQI